MIKAILTSAMALLLPLVGASSPTLPAQIVVLHCGSLVDVEHERMVANTDVLIENGRISKVEAAIVAPAGAMEVDLRGQHCLPGLMDVHAHLFIDSTGGTDADNVLKNSSAADALLGLKNAQRMLHNGFTTLRDPGDADLYFATIDLREAINRGDFIGPRLFVAPHMLSPLGGHGDLNEIRGDIPEILGSVVHAGTDNIREAVRREVKYGADWIKIAASGGVMSQRDNPRLQSWTDEEMAAFADEAHRLGVKITAHVHSNRAALAAAHAGFDSIEHGTMLDDATVQEMKEHKVVLVPTLYVLEWILQKGVGGGITVDNYRKAQLISTLHHQSFMKAYKAGVKIAMGSDPIFPHDEVPREFASMVHAGMRPWDALKAGTINPAELLGLKEDTGSLKAGMRADIVAVPGDPVADITLLQKVSFVMSNGMIIRDSATR